MPFLAVFAIWGACVDFTGSRRAYAEIDPAAVQRSIDRGLTYLRKSQKASGGWQEHQGQSCGLSALCALAMLNAGVPKDDPDLARAMQYLRSVDPTKIYSIALQTLVYCDYGAAGDLPRIRRNVRLLENAQILPERSQSRAGGWGYSATLGNGDPSNSQFALLALGAAVDRGIEVNPKTFELGLKYWTDRQAEDGGWSYSDSRQATGSMTCAGVASVIIARGRLGNDTSQIVQSTITCCGGQADQQDPIERGLAWLGNYFSVRTNPGPPGPGSVYYYLYALERVGRLSGRRFIGGHDWYREGAEQLVSIQDELQGYWNGPNGAEVGTSFALLFLGKGKRQVVVARLKHSDANNQFHWQSHPDGLRHLVRKIEQSWRRDLTWQTIDSDSASVTDLLQTPVLVISGREALQIDDRLVGQLKEYIHQGGTLLFEADSGDGCGENLPFSRSVALLCERLIEGGKLEKLPIDHPVWFAQRRVNPSKVPPSETGKPFWMYGVQACCRTSIFVSPRSLSCRWELAEMVFRRRKIPPSAKMQIDAMLGIGENIVAYATGRELQDKLEQRLVIEGAPPPELQRDANQFAMLAFDAGGQEARRALGNVATMISRRLPVKWVAASEPIAFDRQQLQEIAVLWIHGQTAFEWTSQERKVIQHFVENDGVIIASAICGRDAFSDSFRKEMKSILGEMAWKTADPSHPVMVVPGGYDLASVTTRLPANRGQPPSKRRGIPLLEIGELGGVTNVFFSPLDLSCALESPNSIQCPGYGTEDAAKIVANLLLYSLQQ